MENQGQLLETVASTLSAAGMHDKAGEFYEEMNQLQRAMDRCVFGGWSNTVMKTMWLRRNRNIWTYFHIPWAGSEDAMRAVPS